MLVHGLGHGAEDNALLGKPLLVGGRHGNRVKDRIHGDTGQHFLLVERNTQLVVGLFDLRIDVIKALWPILVAFWRRVIRNGLEIDGIIMDVLPVGFRHVQPVPIGLKTPFKEPLRLVFLGRDKTDRVLAKARCDPVLFDIGHEAGFVPFLGESLNRLSARGHDALP
jgi:hypothetical protein